jgi:outer membrane receptor protein involved in Fe transport
VSRQLAFPPLFWLIETERCMRKRASLAAWLLVSVSLALGMLAPWSIPTAFAQVSADGTIRGTVHDEQGGVLPGVSVTATSQSAPRPVVAVSDADGTYRLLNLVPGEYVITAELQGFSRMERRGLVIAAGLNLTVDIDLKIGALGETLEVKADTPMLESEKSSKTVNISGDLQRALPLTARKDFSDYLEVTPGVTARGFDQASGGQVYMVRGTDIESHVTLIDGADMGSFRQNWAGLYIGLSTDATQDVQVKTGGSDAASPIAMGAITQIATKSGTNQLKGAGGFIFTSKSWNGNNAAAGESPAITEVFQPDLSLGGPIARDKAWYFGSFRYVRRNVGISRDASQLAGLKAFRSGFDAFDNESRSKYYFIKGTAQINPKHQLTAFYEYDLNPDETNWAYSADKLNVSAFGGNGVSSRLTSVWNDSLTTKVAVSYNDKSLNGSINAYDKYPGTGPELDIWTSTAVSSGNLSGAGQIGQLNNLFSRSAQPASKFTIAGDATYFKSGWLGHHELQTGVYLQQFDYTSTVNYANNGDALNDAVLKDASNPSLGYTIFRRRVYDTSSVLATDVSAHDYAFYVQDSWKPTSRVTVNVGVRFDQVRVNDNLFDVATMDAWHVGPRVGVNYAVTEDRTNIIRASWGRVHDILNATLVPVAGSSVAGYTDFFDNNLDGVFEKTVPQPASTRVSSDRKIDPDRHQPYINEWLAGYQKQLPGQLAIDATWVHRDYRDRPALVESNGIYTNGVFSGVIDESQNLIYLNTNNKWNWFVYNGFEVTVSKRAKSLQILGSYGRNWQHIAGTWQPNDPASFIQPGAFANDRGLGSIRGGILNSLAGDADTRSPSWQPHVARIGATWNGPWDVLASATYSIQAGPYTGPVVTRISAADPAFGPASVTLSNGRTVSNPLATTIRFVGPTRGDGQIETDPLQTLNLRFGKSFTLNGRKLEVDYDVFNALNDNAFQQFKSGGNQVYSTNYGLNADGSIQGQSRQFARAGQLSIRYQF